MCDLRRKLSLLWYSASVAKAKDGEEVARNLTRCQNRASKADAACFRRWSVSVYIYSRRLYKTSAWLVKEIDFPTSEANVGINRNIPELGPFR